MDVYRETASAPSGEHDRSDRVALALVLAIWWITCLAQAADGWRHGRFDGESAAALLIAILLPTAALVQALRKR